MVQKNRKYVRYAIYDLEDNYVFEGTIKELCEYTKKKESCLRSTISHISHNREGRNKIKIEDKKYYIYKMEE